jgi:hypothetical protein
VSANPGVRRLVHHHRNSARYAEASRLARLLLAMLPLTPCGWTSAAAFAEDGAGSVQLMALFGWTRIETAEVYVRAANKRRLVAGSYNLNQHRHRKGVSPPSANSVSETNRRKSSAKSTPQKGGGGPTRTRTWNQTVMSGRL